MILPFYKDLKEFTIWWGFSMAAWSWI